MAEQENTAIAVTEPVKEESLAKIIFKLKMPFRAEEVKWLPGARGPNNTMQAMAYVDARAVMNRLDWVFGPSGWEDEYTHLENGRFLCCLRCRFPGDQWVVHGGGGALSKQDDSGDQIKAAMSEALKNAAIRFGIGRYLYELPKLYLPMRDKYNFAQPPQLPAWALPKDGIFSIGVEAAANAIKVAATGPILLNYLNAIRSRGFRPDEIENLDRLGRQRGFELNFQIPPQGQQQQAPQQYQQPYQGQQGPQQPQGQNQQQQQQYQQPSNQQQPNNGQQRQQQQAQQRPPLSDPDAEVPF